jgi:NAD-dependent deacetylase
MQYREAADLLRSSSYTVALTGAGISTPSGIPDFRSGSDGLWHKHDPMQVASLSTFRTQPEAFFNWFHPLASLIHQARPNPAHLALANLEENGKLKTLITQNIDGLHQRAGSRQILHVHGTLNSLTCVSCYHTFSSDKYLVDYIQNRTIPICPDCSAILKPDVILFEEQLPRETWRRAEEETEKCDLMLVVGSSLEVNPVAQLPYVAVSKGAKLIIVNQQATYIDTRATVRIGEDAAKALPAIFEALSHV